MIGRSALLSLGALLPGLLLLGCSEGGGASADSGAAVTSDLLQSRETIAEDQRTRMSTMGATGGEFGTWLRANVPSSPVDIDTLGFKMGDPAAPVQILEFSDYGCGYCRQFHLEIFPELHDEYVSSGKIQWHYVPMILGIFPNAIEAAMVAECSADAGGDPRTLADALFQRQADWKRASDPMPVLFEIAEAGGAEVEATRSCVAEQRRAPAIAAGSAFASTNGVRGTPTFFVLDYGAIPGAVPVELFREILDTAYAEITRGGGQ